MIETVEQYGSLLKELEKLFDKGEANLSADEQARLEYLAKIIHDYEE